MGIVERWRALLPEDRRYLSAAGLGVAGVVVWALGIRQRLRAPPLGATYGDPECPEAAYVEVLTDAGVREDRARRAWYYAPIITGAADHWEVPRDVMMALVQTESGFNPEAGSGAGAVGLSQMMPGTASSLHKILLEMGQWPFGELDRTDPRQSAWLGAYLMRRLLNKHGGDLEGALAEYNCGGRRCGPGSAPAEWPQETRNYVNGVPRRTRRYRELWSRC